MTSETIKFVKAANYSAGVAGGATVVGPTADGYIHVSFFRELQYPVEQSVEVTQVNVADNPLGVRAEMRKDIGSPKLEHEKELVATVSISLPAVASLAQALTKIAEYTQQNQAQPKQSQP